MRIKSILSVFLIFYLGIVLTAQDFSTQNLLSNLNNHSSGFSAYAQHASLNVPTGYGTVLGLRFWDGLGSDWRTQLAFGTDNNFYYRQSTNTNGTSWTSWYKVFHSGNLNSSECDFSAKQLVAKELFINSEESYPNGWGISHLLWKGHTLFLGSPRGWWRHNQFILRPGGSNNAGEVCENYFALDKAFGVDNYETCVQFSTDGSSNFIKNGNFLIGKTSQTNTSYKLDVAGKIRADEIVVNTTGADFVFEPTYKLRSLSELETFIRTNKHLPDIAPAKEMQENGVSAGEMQTKLLQKVEELTLYVIEKDRQIAEQQQMLMVLKKEIETLKAKP